MCETSPTKSAKSRKKQTHDLLLCLIVKREVTCDWGLWVGVCSHLHWCMCACICVCVCVMGVWVGVNVTANLLTFPKACIPPPERQNLTDAVMTMRHLCHCHPEGHTVGWKGGPALTCWPRAVWNTEPQMGSLTETNEIKKNKRRKEAQTKNSYCSWGEVHSSLWKCTQHLIRTVLQHLSLFLLDLWLCFVWMYDCH